MHECLKRWFDHKRGPPVCPVCAADWTVAPGADAAVASEEGFLNLRELQPGVQAERDTSTYATNSEGRLWTDVHGDRAAHEASLARGDEPPPPPPPDCTPPDDDAIW